MNDNELWIKKIKESLEDYSAPLPPSGWKRMEKQLSASAQPPAKHRRMRLWYGWAAAAAVLIGISTIGIRFMLHSPEHDTEALTSTQLAVATEQAWEQTDNGQPADETIHTASSPGKEATSGKAVRHRTWTAQQRETLAEATLPLVQTEQPAETAPQEDQTGDAGKPSVTTTEKGTEATRKHPATQRPKRKELPFAQQGSKRTKTKGWSMGITVGNMGGLMADNSGSTSSQANATGNIYSGSIRQLNLASTADGSLSIPEGERLIFKEGMPYLMEYSPTVQSAEHKQPVSAGISVRKRLPKGFSVETGLTYTYLASDILYQGTDEKVSQSLHYLGIPLRANWSFIENRRWNIYVSAGGTVEKCVFGKIGSEEETVDPLQFSVMSAIGAQVNLSQHIGIYVEPGVSYYFDDGSEVQTIRKENPFNFTLQAGLRFSY